MSGKPVLYAPFMRNVPGIARQGRDARERPGQRLGRRCGYHPLPEGVFLRLAQQLGQARRKRRIKRVLVQPLDQRAERQDVGRFPGGESAPGLPPVEPRGERRGQPPVGRDDAETLRCRGLALGEALKELRADRGLIPVSAPRP